jgi:hypothetical protein
MKNNNIKGVRLVMTHNADVHCLRTQWGSNDPWALVDQERPNDTFKHTFADYVGQAIGLPNADVLIPQDLQLVRNQPNDEGRNPSTDYTISCTIPLSDAAVDHLAVLTREMFGQQASTPAHVAKAVQNVLLHHSMLKGPRVWDRSLQVFAIGG